MDLDPHDLDLDLSDELLDGDDLPPIDLDEPSPERRPRPPEADKPGQGRLLVTFVCILFGALELQTLLVMMATADGSHAATATMVFGILFVLTVFAWFIGGMLWFSKRFDAHR